MLLLLLDRDELREELCDELREEEEAFVDLEPCNTEDTADEAALAAECNAPLIPLKSPKINPPDYRGKRVKESPPS